MAGAEILRQGGNAIDAAIATALVLGVVSPAGSGLGGGGFAVVWDAHAKKTRVLDFREVAPKAATRDMYANDVVDAQHPSRSIIGGLAVAVPAEPAGLWALHKQLGKLSFDKLVVPAVKLARGGFYPTRRLVRAVEHVLPTLAADDPLRRWMAPGGKAITLTTLVKRPLLADTLVRFGKAGRDAIYEGAIAADLVQAVTSHGGILTAADLAAYEPLWRDPIVGHFRGREIDVAPPPAGGLTALEALQFLDALPPLPKGSLGSSAYDHRIAEALSHAFADRARWMGDPAFFAVPVEKLASPEYAKSLAARFSDAHTLPLEQYGTPVDKGVGDAPHDHGTSHFCVVDGEGNAVAITSTVNLELGSHVEAPRSGILLNDQMDDFAAEPGKPNGFGLVGAEANSIAPGKRPTSSTTPMLVIEDGKVLMCVGGSGGPTIVASSVQAIVAVIDEGVDAETAVAAPRVYEQWRPDRLLIERDVPEDVAQALAKRGHKIVRVPNDGFAPAAQLILRHGDELEAASDPRKGGIPASLPLAKAHER